MSKTSTQRTLGSLISAEYGEPTGAKRQRSEIAIDTESPTPATSDSKFIGNVRAPRKYRETRGGYPKTRPRARHRTNECHAATIKYFHRRNTRRCTTDGKRVRLIFFRILRLPFTGKLRSHRWYAVTVTLLSFLLVSRFGFKSGI